MLIIGLTGGIGMGKSTAAARFKANGIAVFDADAEVHRLYACAAVPLIEAAFPGTTGPGGVDRGRLAAAVLAQPDGFKRIETIIHPRVRDAERAFLHAEKAAGASAAVLEIPLLFETGGDRNVDVVVLVSAPAPVQRRRVLERPAMTPEKLDQILERQMPDAEKRARADYIVDTGGTIAEAQAQIDRIIQNLEGRPATAFDRSWA